MDRSVHAFIVEHLSCELGTGRIQSESELGQIIDLRILLTGQEILEEIRLVAT